MAKQQRGWKMQHPGNDGHHFISRDTGLHAYLVYVRPLVE